MAKDSRTQRLPENFYSTISRESNQRTMRPSSNPNVSQFRRDHSKMPSADVVFPMNNSSAMQNFRKNFVNELELTLPTRAGYASQRRISEYFAEVKNVEPENCAQGGARTTKRSLQELKMKYDSVQNMVANLSKDPTCAEQATVENETATRAKRSRLSTQNENAIVPASSKSQMSPVASKSQPTAKKVKPEQEYVPSFVHLVGHVDNVLRWSQILRNSNILVVYNVLGYFISSMDGIHAKEKFVYIRSNNGIILECSYFEIDRPVPKIPKNQFVGCFGHLIGAQRFRLFSIDVIDDADSNKIRRLLYLSQRVTHELSNRKLN